MSKIIVTGGAGFIGSHLTDGLIEQGHEVTVIDDLSRGKVENLNPEAEFVEKSIVDFEDIQPHFDGVDVVFHLAALARVRPSIENPLPYNDVNVTGALNVFEASRLAGVGKVIFASSSSVYGDCQQPVREAYRHSPMNPYALQKSIGEQYLRLYFNLYGMNYTILRFFNVYGTRQILGGAYSTVIGTFLKQKSEGQPLTIYGDGHQRRDFTHVRDTVDACIKAIDCPSGDYNIGRGNNKSVKEIADMISPDQVHLPAVPGEARETLCENAKARNTFKWKPTIDVTEEVIQEMADYENIGR